MTLFNHLFGGKSVAEELVADEAKHMALWREHLANFDKREQLCKHFNVANVDKALANFEETKIVLDQIASLISAELVHITDEKKTDAEIIADLEKLKLNHEIEELGDTIVAAKQIQGELTNLFHGIFALLRTELHLIELIKRNPSRELLIRLFKLIFHQEARYYQVFREKHFYDEDRHIHSKIAEIARAILL